MRFLKPALVWVGALAAGVIAQAGQLGVSIDSTPVNYGLSSWTLGYEFSVSAPATVTGLATFSPYSTTQGASEVGLWDSSGDLLAGAWIAEGTSVTNYFAEVAINPVDLVVGQDYIVGAYDPSNDGYTGDGGYEGGSFSYSYASNLNFITDEFTGGWGFPNSSTGVGPSQPSWFGGNVVLGSASVPDAASSAAMFLVGLGALVAGRRGLRSTR